MPKCISCNEVYADQLRRCPHCGYSAEPVAPDSRPARGAPRPRRRGRVLRIAVIAIAAAVAGLGAVIAWPSPKAGVTDDLPRLRRTPLPTDEFDPSVFTKPDEIEPLPVAKDFQVTEARLDGGEIAVVGTCSPRAIAEIRVNGHRATILKDGSRFTARVPAEGDAVEVVAAGVAGDRATLRKEVLRVEEGAAGEEVRLLSHADGATLHVPSAQISYLPRSGPAAARTIDVPLPNIENRFRIEGSHFVLYRAPDGFTCLRLTPNGMRTFLREVDEQEMVLVAGGLSWRGMGQGEPNGPRHLVELSPFLIDRTEVTCAQYSQYLHAIGRGGGIRYHPEDPGINPQPVGWTTDDPPEGTENLPVTGISWYAAWSYARWVGGRLPTEAEWERAAAGPMGLPYPWGGELDPSRCRMKASGPLPSDSLLAGAGFYDLLHMSGNVREWCLDRYDPRWYLRGARKDPRGPSRNTHRVVRGGSFLSAPEALRLQFRDHFDGTKKAPDLGFRVVMPWDGVSSPDGD